MALTKNSGLRQARHLTNEVAQWLQCLRCHARFEVGPIFSGCPDCQLSGGRSPLEMRYAQGAPSVNVRDCEATGRGVWRWQERLPKVHEQNRVTLGEGSTNLLPLPVLAAGLRLYLKNETTNPTWSWKDRPNAVSVSLAKHFGYKKVVAISTGNHGNAVSAMAATAGLKATVFCNADTPQLQMALMQAYGARVIRGGDPEAMVLELVNSGEYFPCTVISPRAGYSNPYGVEGFKTIAFELYQRLGKVPERVFVGVGSGDGIYGIWKGFRELRDMRICETTPRIYGCQTTGANSLVRAFRSRALDVTALASIDTVASSLAERVTGQQALDAIYESGGAALEVKDEEALRSMHEVTRMGVALEPSSAVPIACLQNLLTSAPGEAEGETWVTIGSGSVTKWPEELLRDFHPPELLPANVSVLD